MKRTEIKTVIPNTHQRFTNCNISSHIKLFSACKVPKNLAWKETVILASWFRPKLVHGLTGDKLLVKRTTFNLNGWCDSVNTLGERERIGMVHVFFCIISSML